MANIVIFLDIDGVLCTTRSHLALSRPGGLMTVWDPLSAALVRKLCIGLDARIVISSTWRKLGFRDCLWEMLKEHGLFQYLYEIPTQEQQVSGGGAWMTPVQWGSRPRGDEIKEWLEEFGAGVEHYIILDDDSDMLEEQLPYFTKTDQDEGFGGRDFWNIRTRFVKLGLWKDERDGTSESNGGGSLPETLE